MNTYNLSSLDLLPTRSAFRAPKGKQHKLREDGKRKSPVIIRERNMQEAREAKKAHA